MGKWRRFAPPCLCLSFWLALPRPVAPNDLVRELVAALEKLRSATDRLMGDTDPCDDTDPSVVAMQAAAQALHRAKEAGV